MGGKPTAVVVGGKPTGLWWEGNPRGPRGGGRETHVCPLWWEVTPCGRGERETHFGLVVGPGTDLLTTNPTQKRKEGRVVGEKPTAANNQGD